MQVEQRILYELWDTHGKVMETRDKEQAYRWKHAGMIKRMRDGSKSKWIRRRRYNVRIS